MDNVADPKINAILVRVEQDAQTMLPIAGLLAFSKYTQVRKGTRATERGELLRFFFDQGFTVRTGKPLSMSALGSRLAHYTLDDLYALKSSYNDRFTRNGKLAATKWWWWATKTLSTGTPP